MRANTLSFLSWLNISLILFAVPALPSLVPPASAAQLPTEQTLWRPYGPYVKQVLITVFSNANAELGAFRTGQLDWYDRTVSRTDVQGLRANPDALVSQSLPSSRFQIDINHHAPLFGIAQQRPRTDFTAIDDGEYDGLQSTMEPTPEGIQARQAIAHLIDKASFVRDFPLCTGGFCIAIDDTMSPRACVEAAAPCTTLAQRASWDTLHTTQCATVGATTPCAYKIADGPGGGRPSEADLQAARDHLFAAGLKDSDGDGLLDFPATGQVIFVIQARLDTRRLQIGTVMADALDSLFEKGPNDEPVVKRLINRNFEYLNIVFYSEPADDWHLYTGGWSTSFDASHLYALHGSAFASDFCGGTQSLFNINYGFYCNPAFDERVEKGSYDALTVSAFNLPHQEAHDIAGKTVMIIQTHTLAGPTLAHNGWDGLVHFKGDGFTSSFNWLNMRAKPDYVSTGGLGPPGGGNPELIRAGFSQSTFNLNIFHGGVFSEFKILFSILDSPAGYNPRAASNPYFEPYETSLTNVGEVFNTFGADQIPGNNDDEPVTVIEMVFRSDLQFHDGVQVTAEDFLKSGLAFRDAPARGFGLSYPWEPMIASSIPIPGSNCGNLCVQLVMRGHTFLHRVNLLGSPILPLHLWDTNGDGFICSGLNIGSCSGEVPETVLYEVDGNYRYDSFEPVIAGPTPAFGTILKGDPRIKIVDSNNSNDWERGETVVYDTNGNSRFDANEPVIAEQTPTPGAFLRSHFRLRYVDTDNNYVWSPTSHRLSRPADPTTDINYDPMASGIMIGHGPFMCLNLATGRPGGSCSRTADGTLWGQSMGPRGTFTLTRYDEYSSCCPTDLNSPLHRLAQADIDRDWKITANDLALAVGNPFLQELIATQFDFTLGGSQGKNLNEVDLTNTGNAYPVA